MLRKIFCFGLLVGLFNFNVQAADFEETLYGGVQAAKTTYEDDGFEVEPGALIFRAGGYLEKGAAMEVRLGVAIAGLEDELSDGGVDFDYRVESLLGLYGLYHVGWGSDASLYGIAGLTRTHIKQSSVSGRVSLHDTSLSAGIGVNFGGFNVEYIQYLFHKDYDFTAISFGYVSGF